jgi:two-component system OmpR family response regulator
MRILLVEDHAELAREIARRIEHAGFGADHVKTIEGAAMALQDCPYSIALLDRRLPDGDGLSLVPNIRERQPEARILMLTALDAVDDRIEGLDAGADDYLTKPFNLDEMMARIRANLRKSRGDRTPPAAVGALSFDFDARMAAVENRPVLLLRREFLLLEALMRRINCVVSRETLTAAVYGFDVEVQEHALTALVSRLRARLAEHGAGVEIHSARGLGYMITRAKTKAKTAR